MKVSTQLKSGEFLANAAQSASQGVTNVAGFFSRADQQATSLTQGVAQGSSKLYNCLKTSFNLG
jgi:hypothetical protein